MGVEATEEEGEVVVLEEGDMEAMEVEAMDGTIAEWVMHCSLAAASVALFVGSCTKEISVCATFAQEFS